MRCAGTPELGRAGDPAQLEPCGLRHRGHTLVPHRSCKFQETPCQPYVVGEGAEAKPRRLPALGEQMCLPGDSSRRKFKLKCVCSL